jgi:nitroreductase
MVFPHKPAPTQLPILRSVTERWSPLAFSAQPVEQSKIDIFFEAARWAPSSFNEQPWRYLYATKEDSEDRQKLESLLLQGNKWAKDAYILMITFTKRTFAKNGKENYHALHDLGCATGYLALQLPSLGLIGHEMAGFLREAANGILGVPPDFIPGSMMAIGYPGDHAALPQELREREEAPRERMVRRMFAFKGKWPQ